jgi:hypothetical protein
MKVGDRVRVKTSVVVYHHPSDRGNPVDIDGKEGTIDKLATEWKGRPITANFPLVVKFEKNFRAHLREEELEVI